MILYDILKPDEKCHNTAEVSIRNFYCERLKH